MHLTYQAMHDLILMKNYNYPSSKKQLITYAEGVVHSTFLEFGVFLLFDILPSKNDVFFQLFHLGSLVRSDEQMQQ